MCFSDPCDSGGGGERAGGEEVTPNTIPSAIQCVNVFLDLEGKHGPCSVDTSVDVVV